MSNKPRTSLQKLRDFIGMQGGELGNGWVRDKENFRYIPLKDFLPANGQPRASYYLTKTDIAVAMGLLSEPLFCPSPATPPTVENRNDEGREQATNTPASPSTGVADGKVVPGMQSNAVTSRQNRNRNAVSPEVQLARLQEYIKSQGQKAGEDVALAPGWSVSRTRRSSGKSEGHIDFYYHPPEEFVAVGQHKWKYRSFREVANAHGLLQEDMGPQLLHKTLPAKRSCSSIYAAPPLPSWESFGSRSAGRRARTTSLTLPFLEAASDLGRKGANRAVKEPHHSASAGGEVVRGADPSAEAAKKIRDSQPKRSRHAACAAFAGAQLTPILVSSGASDSEMSVNIFSVSTERSSPGVDCSSKSASPGVEDPNELVSKMATDNKGAADADEQDTDAQMQEERDRSDWQKMEEEMQALRQRNRELEKEVQQCKSKLKEVEVAEQMLGLSDGCNSERRGHNLQP